MFPLDRNIHFHSKWTERRRIKNELPELCDCDQEVQVLMHHAQVSEFCIIMEDIASVVSHQHSHPHSRRRILWVRWGGKCLMIFVYSGHETQSSSAASFPLVLLWDPRALVIRSVILLLELQWWCDGVGFMEWRFRDQESSWGRDAAGEMGSDKQQSK